MILPGSLKRGLRWAGYTVLGLVVFVIAAFGLLQTAPGLGWAAQICASLASSPGFTVRIAGLGGTVPFDMRAERIEVSDAQGVWLRLGDVRLDLSAAALAAWRVQIGTLSVASIELFRQPQPAESPTRTPLADTLRIPHLPVAVTVDRLAVTRLMLDAPAVGELIETTIEGHATQRGYDTDIGLDLHRTDDKPGSISLQLHESGADPVLSLHVNATEPTGLVLNRVLNRTDNLPLTASLAGEGPLAHWQGRLEVAAGQSARLDADVQIAATRDTVLSLDGTAAPAQLLPPEFAAAIGDAVPVSATATLKENGAIALEALSLRAAAGSLTATGSIGGPERAMSGQMQLRLPHLAGAGRYLGQPLQGAAELDIVLSGTEDRPRLRFDGIGTDLKTAQSGADRVQAHLDVQWPEHPDNPASRIEIAAQGGISGITLPEKAQNLGRDLSWSLEASAARDGGSAELTHFGAHGAGVDVEGSGKLAEAGRTLSGQMQISIGDLRPLTGLFGHPVAGEMTLVAVVEQQSPDLVTARVEGATKKLRAGIPAAEALIGDTLTINGAGHRGVDGAFVIDALALRGADAEVIANGRVDLVARQLAGTLDATIATLQPVGKELGSRLAGRLAAHLTAEGPLDQPGVRARLEASDLAVGTAVLDHVRLEAQIADAPHSEVLVTGDFRSAGLDGSLGLRALLGDHSDLLLRQFRLKAAGGSINGDAHINVATLLTSGTVEARLPDLAPWSRIAGIPLGGKAELNAKLAVERGQAIDIAVSGDGLAAGSGAGRIAIGHLAASSKIADALGTPSGSGQAAVSGVAFASGSIAKASLNLGSTGPGRFTFRADASGSVQAPLSIALNGSAEVTPRTSAADLQLARLNGVFGADKFQLTRPLTFSLHGSDVVMTGLALTYGRGQITGDASRRGSALALQLRARDLDLAAFGRLAGRKDVGGTLDLAADVGGTVGAPAGRFALNGRGLRFATPKQRMPSLGLDLNGNWDGRELGFTGHIRGLKDDALDVSGSAPLVLTPAPFGLAVPPQGRLALRLQGSGEIGNLADLLPLGEDTITGRFALDAGINGTPAAPAASGRFTISDGRYANFATGAVLTHLRADVSGDRDRVTVREFSASDTGAGTLTARGSVVLAGAAATADLTATLQNFRLLGRDDAVLTGSGNVAIAGSIAAPKVTAQLTTAQGNLRIPDSLPPSVTKLQVIEIHSRAPVRRQGRPAATLEKASPPALPAALEVKIAMPGQVFVRGHGLDSEWRGNLTVAGSSAAPQIVGSLEAVRGTFDVLGKTFKVTRGTISFDGAKSIDPTLDLVAEVAAGDIVAQVLVTGSASAPKIAMSSTPALPQEQILSYVLFNRDSTRITAAEGIQVAQAAATLAGGGSGMLDRLRGRLGLDRLMLGSSATGNASSNLNPAAGGSSTTGTSVSGGKYVAEGVYVGATQGLTPESSKVVVEVEVRPHVTVEGDFSQSGGSGLGLNYKYDY